MQTITATRALKFANINTYLVALLFISGNIVMPQIFHLVPGGGISWLPIYFFTLIGSCIYGWRVGLITALLSPVVNHLVFGMPHLSVLPAILIKSTLLAIVAGVVCSRCRRLTVGLLALIVLTYQILGTLCEWPLTGSLFVALQDFRIGIPGMFLQIFGGWAIVHFLKNSKV